MLLNGGSDREDSPNCKYTNPLLRISAITPIHPREAEESQPTVCLPPKSWGCQTREWLRAWQLAGLCLTLPLPGTRTTDKGDYRPCFSEMDSSGAANLLQVTLSQRYEANRRPSLEETTVPRLGRRKLRVSLHTPLPPSSRSPRGQPGHCTSVPCSRLLRPPRTPPSTTSARASLHPWTHRLHRHGPHRKCRQSVSAAKISPQRTGATQRNVPGLRETAARRGSRGAMVPTSLTLPSSSSALREHSLERQLRNHPEQEHLTMLADGRKLSR